MAIFRLLLLLFFIYMFIKKNILHNELNYYEDKVYFLVLILMAIVALIDFKNKLSHKNNPKT